MIPVRIIERKAISWLVVVVICVARPSGSMRGAVPGNGCREQDTLIMGSKIVAPSYRAYFLLFRSHVLHVNDIVCAHDNSMGQKNILAEEKLNKSSCPSVTILAARAPAPAS
jgi:hypothetical protein